EKSVSASRPAAKAVPSAPSAAPMSKALQVTANIAGTPNVAAPTIPQISSITPSVPGDAVSSIAINGSGFDATTEVFLGTNPLTVTSANATQIIATGYVPLT